jgi:hypothetical protein
MPEKRFIYNPDRLVYRQIEKNLKVRFLRGFAFLSAGLFLATAIVVAYSMVFDTPREREIRQENLALAQDYELLVQKYEQIDTVLKELRGIDENIYKTIFETDPVGGSTTGSERLLNYEELLKLSNELIVDSTYEKLEQLLSGVSSGSTVYKQLELSLSRKAEMLECIPAIQPISNPDLNRLASGFGERMHPYYKIMKFHSGMDFTAPVGTPVFATGKGIVETLDKTSRGRGNTIVINHDFGYKTVYSFLDAFNVRAGQRVNRHDLIGWVGNTGLSSAPHLHYEVHLNGEPVDPVNYYFLDLSPEKYTRMLELSRKSGQSFD